MVDTTTDSSKLIASGSRPPTIIVRNSGIKTESHYGGVTNSRTDSTFISGANNAHRNYIERGKSRIGNMDGKNANYSENIAFPVQKNHTRDDMGYCTEISKKSVARAALHFGVEKMDRVALDVMGHVLISYLERIGNILAATVEKSRRTSAHCNVLDALYAVEACTAPAACQVSMSSENEIRNAKGEAAVGCGGVSMDMGFTYNSGVSSQDRGWEGLACFLFGKDWLDIPLPGLSDGIINGCGPLTENYNTLAHGVHNNVTIDTPPIGVTNDTLTTGTISKGGGGKQSQPVHPCDKQTSSYSRQVSFPITGANPPIKQQGWNAPFLDTISPFPITRSCFEIANPHRFPSSISSSFHSLATKGEACRDDYICCPSQLQNSYPGERYHLHRKGGFIGEDDRQIDDAAIMAEINAESSNLGIPEESLLNGINSFWGVVDSQYTKCTTGDETQISVGTLDVNQEGNIMWQKNGIKSRVYHEKAIATTNKKRTHFDIDGDDYINECPRKMLKMRGSGDRQTCALNCTPSLLGECDRFQSEEDRTRRLKYIPSFYPPFPPEIMYDHSYNSMATILSTDVHTNHQDDKSFNSLPTSGPRPEPIPYVSINAISGEYDENSHQAIRSSLVSLERSACTSYWGTGYENHNSSSTVDISSDVPNEKSVTDNDVPASLIRRPDVPIKPEPCIVPLSRVSRSRICRILEGSMDSC